MIKNVIEVVIFSDRLVLDNNHVDVDVDYLNVNDKVDDKDNATDKDNLKSGKEALIGYKRH